MKMTAFLHISEKRGPSEAEGGENLGLGPFFNPPPAPLSSYSTRTFQHFKDFRNYVKVVFLFLLLIAIIFPISCFVLYFLFFFFSPLTLTLIWAREWYMTPETLNRFMLKWPEVKKNICIQLCHTYCLRIVFLYRVLSNKNV
jgi:hypothetical protein